MIRRILCTGLLVSLLSGCGTSQPEHYDLLIRGGTVLDGTGTPGKRADVGIRGEQIAFVGNADGATAGEILDATGLIVAPGFIDAHNHADGIAIYLQERNKSTRPILNEGFLTQGVTTIVGGPDGGYAPSNIRKVIGKFEQVGISTNYAFYVGHNGIRSEVLGSAQRAPTADELQKMVGLVEEGMRLGAVGLSSGLMYEPGMFSDTAEVIALAKAVKPFDGIYDSHVRDPVFKLIASDEEAIQIGREAGIPTKIAHEKAVGLVNHGRIAEVIKLVERARASGHEVVTDQYPYDGAATASLAQLIVIKDVTPPGIDLPQDAVLRKTQDALGDSRRLAAIRNTSEQGIDGGFSWIKAVGYGSMRIVESTDFPQLIGRNLELLAKERGVDPFALIVELIKTSRTPTLLTLGSIEEDSVRELMTQPWNMFASDGAYVGREGQVAQHPRSTGTFTRVLGHYVRDEKVLSLAEAVRKMTSLPADFLRLYDRGRIQVGKAADITIFNAAQVRDTSTWSRPETLSEGIVHVVVNGKLAMKDGEVTGAAPGKFIRRQSSAH